MCPSRLATSKVWKKGLYGRGDLSRRRALAKAEALKPGAAGSKGWKKIENKY